MNSDDLTPMFSVRSAMLNTGSVCSAPTLGDELLLLLPEINVEKPFARKGSVRMTQFLAH